MLTLAPPTGAAPSGDSLPAYVDPGVSRFVLFANSHWDISNSSAPVVQFIGSPPASGYQIEGGDKPRYIWAATCPKGEQTLKFHRKVWLPGPSQALDFAASATAIHAGSRYWSDPFKSIKLIVNGTVLKKLDHAGTSGSVTPAQLADVLRYGDNVFKVVVVKRANPDYIKTCGKNAPVRLGIQFSVSGSNFLNDLAIRRPTASETGQHFSTFPGAESTIPASFTVFENGPAATRAGVFDLRVQTTGGMKLSSQGITASASSPFGACDVSAAHVTCPITSWFAPETTAKVLATYDLTVPQDEPLDAVEILTMDWSILRGATSGQSDADYTNDSAHFQAIYCMPKATSNGCDGYNH